MAFLTPSPPRASPATPTTCCLARSSRHPPSSASLPPRVVASDLDGTLLTTSNHIHAKNVASLIRAIHSGLVFLPATGKSPSGAFSAMGPLGDFLLRNNHSRGVFLNGLLVKSDTRTIYQRAMGQPAAKFVLTTAEARGLVPLFYSADTVFVRQRSRLTDMFIVSHEPVPTAIDLDAAMSRQLHKALLLDPRGDVRRHRPALEAAFRGVAQITQARPDVLEVVPLGAGKGAGVERLLCELGYGRGALLAIGDNENDVDMLAMAGMGVAVGNAVQQVKDVADEIVCHCDDGAVAEALTRFVL